MKRVGLIGWRGMVGSVLMQRMLEEQDFDLIEPVFFTTSNVGGQGPSVGKDIAPLKDAYTKGGQTAPTHAALGIGVTTQLVECAGLVCFEQSRTCAVGDQYPRCSHGNLHTGLKPLYGSRARAH